ncbi:MAG TPA: hypothetical protein DDY93_15990 [Dehalococcoidia bacterium]|nr:hypothetical protein [Dehalococcoidia bacterium]
MVALLYLDSEHVPFQHHELDSAKEFGRRRMQHRRNDFPLVASRFYGFGQTEMFNSLFLE